MGSLFSPTKARIPPVVAPPTVEDPSIREAKEKQRIRAQKRRGTQSTILAGKTTFGTKATN